MKDIYAGALARTAAEDSKLIVFLCKTDHGVMFHLSAAGLDQAVAMCGNDDAVSEGNWVPAVFDGIDPVVCEKCRRIRLMERLAE